MSRLAADGRLMSRPYTPSRSVRVLCLDHGHDVFLAHHEELFAIHLHFGAAVLAEQDAVADFDVQCTDVAVFQDLALAHGNDLALDRLFGSAVGNDDAASRLALFFYALDDDAIVQG